MLGTGRGRTHTSPVWSHVLHSPASTSSSERQPGADLSKDRLTTTSIFWLSHLESLCLSHFSTNSIQVQAVWWRAGPRGSHLYLVWDSLSFCGLSPLSSVWSSVLNRDIVSMLGSCSQDLGFGHPVEEPILQAGCQDIKVPLCSRAHTLALSDAILTLPSPHSYSGCHPLLFDGFCSQLYSFNLNQKSPNKLKRLPILEWCLVTCIQSIMYLKAPTLGSLQTTKLHVSMFHLGMFLFSVIYCTCEETFSHVFVSFLLNRIILENLAPALLSNLSVPLKPKGLFFFFKLVKQYILVEKESREMCKVEK